MRKIAIFVVAFAGLAAMAWQNRTDLLVWAMPLIQDLVNPIPPNRPIEWQQGPATAAAPPGRESGEFVARDQLSASI